MTGTSVADAGSLQSASVGMSMGTACQLTKDASDLVILDSDFQSIFDAIMWGRTIYENVRKFMQFQLTVNLTLCTVVVLTSITLGRSNFHVVELLWLNLIMDTLGAVAICTEPYSKTTFQKATSGEKATKGAMTRRIRKTDHVLDGYIWRSILTQFAYQTVCLLVLIYFGVFMFFDETFNIVTTGLRNEDGTAAGPLVLDTIVFHTFVLMCLFNQINCRVITPPENINIFATFCNNIYFWLIFGFELALQQLFVHWASGTLGGSLLGMSGLTWR